MLVTRRSTIIIGSLESTHLRLSIRRKSSSRYKTYLWSFNVTNAICIFPIGIPFQPPPEGDVSSLVDTSDAAKSKDDKDATSAEAQSDAVDTMLLRRKSSLTRCLEGG